MIVASIQWETDDREILKKLPSTIHVIDIADFKYANEWLYDKYKVHVKLFHVLGRGFGKMSI